MRHKSLLFFFAILFWIFLYIILQSEYNRATVDSYEGRFTFISPFANAGYWGNAAHGMKNADDLYNTNTKFVGFLNAETAQASEAIRLAVCSSPDGIITSGENSEDIINALKYATAEGIPVVLIDNDNKEIDRLCYIGSNDYEAGRLAGKDIAQDAEESLHVAVIIGSAAIENQQERLRGFEDELYAHPKCTIDAVIETNYNLLVLRQLLPQLLEENSQINAIFCAEGYSSIIAGEILTSMGPNYDNIRIVVFGKATGILEHVASGRYYSTIVQAPDTMGSLAVKVLKEYQDGILPQNDTIYTESISIHKENLSDITEYESEGVIWHLYNGNPRQALPDKN